MIEGSGCIFYADDILGRVYHYLGFGTFGRPFMTQRGQFSGAYKVFSSAFFDSFMVFQGRTTFLFVTAGVIS